MEYASRQLELLSLRRIPKSWHKCQFLEVRYMPVLTKFIKLKISKTQSEIIQKHKIILKCQIQSPIQQLAMEYKKHLSRIADMTLDLRLKAFGVVQIASPEWCGKTTTAKRPTESVIKMQDPDRIEGYLATARTKPSLLLKGATPESLELDLNTFGFIFECLCFRDLSAYSQALGGCLSYYHDRLGLMPRPWG